jgi:hypothetical protein
MSFSSPSMAKSSLVNQKLHHLPFLDPEILAYEELKRDPHFSYLPRFAIPELIASLLKTGQQIAQQQPSFSELKQLVNHLLKQGVRIHFASVHPLDDSVRAQYQHRHPRQITIYQRSLTEMQQFFQSWIGTIPEDEIIRLHLYHEWFHYLEESQVGRVDQRYAHLSCKRWGPKQWFTQKKPLLVAREIAAHTFTQEKMNLPWSPLLLDQWIAHFKQGDSTAKMREQFWELKKEYQALLASLAEDTDDEALD